MLLRAAGFSEVPAVQPKGYPKVPKDTGVATDVQECLCADQRETVTQRS